MSCYFIAQINIHNRQEYKRYEDGTDSILAQHGAEVLVVEDSPIILEGEWPCTRIVVIRFPSEAQARQWYNSPEYQVVARHRFRASSAAAILARGRD